MTDIIELMSWWDWSPLGPFKTPFDKLDTVLTPAQIKEWKAQALEAMGERFAQRRGRKGAEEKPEAALYEQIGRLKMDLDFLSGKLGR